MNVLSRYDDGPDLVRLIALIRWAGVLLGLVQAFLTVNPRPVGGPWLVLAAALVMAGYNVPATLARRVPPAWIPRLAVLTLAGDFLVCTAWTMLAANDIYSTSYAVYTLVAVEAAVLYRRRGTVGFVSAFLVAYAALYWERAHFFGFAVDPGSILFRSMIPILVSVFTGNITAQKDLERDAAEEARQEASAQARRSHALYLVASRIARTLKRDYVLETVMDSLHGLYPERWHGIFLSDATDRLELTHVRGHPTEVAINLQGRQGLADLFEPMVIADLANTDFLGECGALLPDSLRAYRSAVCVSLRGNDRVFGILVSLDSAREAFRPAEVEFVEALGNQTSIALENAQLYEDVETMSLTDATTALFNRRAFDHRLEEELQRAARYQQPLSLLMVDVDHFKAYNDANGHLAGDTVLRAMGQILTTQDLRKSDLAFRFGGEEFAVIMPMTGSAEALAVAERLCQRVRQRQFPHGHAQPGGRLTVSIGVASFPEHADAGRELVGRADLALYHSKESGRDRSTVYRTELQAGPADGESRSPARMTP